MMKGVLLEVPEAMLAERRRSGADRNDEMWNVVLHMNPPPTIDHQDFEYELECWLRTHLKAASGGQVFHNVGVVRAGGWPQDYRAPDLILVGPERRNRLLKSRIEVGPTVAIEIRSHSDETNEKLAFYAAIDTAEVWVIHRDTKLPEVVVLTGDNYQVQIADGECWLLSPNTDIRLRSQVSDRIEVMLGEDQTTAVSLPER